MPYPSTLTRTASFPTFPARGRSRLAFDAERPPLQTRRP
jgi:hypothetical protein